MKFKIKSGFYSTTKIKYISVSLNLIRYVQGKYEVQSKILMKEKRKPIIIRELSHDYGLEYLMLSWQSCPI